jgi:RNA polymerase sigma-70 factor (sigma-E family)
MGSSVVVIDASLAGAAEVGDDRMALSSFGDFYELHYRTMVGLAQALVDTSESAEEIVQDAFVKVYERWDRLDQPVGYLNVTVVNGARSELRKREVRRRVGLRARPADPPAERDYLIDALGGLSPKQRTAIVLRFFAQMSERETAETMGVRPGTVKSLTSRGLAELRRVIQP